MSSAWAKLRRALLPSHAAATNNALASSVANPGVFPLFVVSHRPDGTDALAECDAASSGDGCYFKETVTHREASVTLRYPCILSAHLRELIL